MSGVALGDFVPGHETFNPKPESKATVQLMRSDRGQKSLDAQQLWLAVSPEFVIIHKDRRKA